MVQVRISRKGRAVISRVVADSKNQERSTESEASRKHIARDPKKHISISILKGYPYLIGLHYKGVYMGYHYLNFCLCAFFGALIV